MKFVRENENTNRYVDTIFTVVNAAKADPDAINATAGCLYSEEGKLFTFKTITEGEQRITSIQRSAYASSPAGNSDYIQEMSEHVLESRVHNSHAAMATPGGTGAIFTAMHMCLNENDTILYPEIAWGNYKVMSEEMNLKPLTYDVYDLNDLFTKIDQIEGKVFLIINSPCGNPLGNAYTFEEWKQIIDKLNSLNKEAVLLCDIAYIDYASKDPKAFFELFNELSDDLLVLIAASCSKSFSYYGQRLGLLIAIHNDKEYLDHFINLCTRTARSVWSNLNNSAMINIASILKQHKDEYHEELNAAKAMLKKRVDLFALQARQCGLELYRFSDGFFVTVKMQDNQSRDAFHQRLIDHHIYTIKVNKGIRIGLCSVPLNQVDGLALKIKELM